MGQVTKVDAKELIALEQRIDGRMGDGLSDVEFDATRADFQQFLGRLSDPQKEALRSWLGAEYSDLLPLFSDPAHAEYARFAGAKPAAAAVAASPVTQSEQAPAVRRDDDLPSAGVVGETRVNASATLTPSGSNASYVKLHIRIEAKNEGEANERLRIIAYVVGDDGKRVPVPLDSGVIQASKGLTVVNGPGSNVIDVGAGRHASASLSPRGSLELEPNEKVFVVLEVRSPKSTLTLRTAAATPVAAAQ